MEFSEYQERTNDTNVFSKAISDMLAPVGFILGEVYFDREIEDEDLWEAMAAMNKLERLLNISYALLGYGGEVGELQNKFKKVLRGDKEDWEFTESAYHELGDSLYYFAQTAKQIGHSADRIAERNIEKLASRKDRGVIQGDGDNR